MQYFIDLETDAHTNKKHYLPVGVFSFEADDRMIRKTIYKAKESKDVLIDLGDLKRQIAVGKKTKSFGSGLLKKVLCRKYCVQAKLQKRLLKVGI